MKKLLNWFGLAGAYIKLNLQSHLAYRGAFISQVVAMMINNSVWVIFWALFFQRFPLLHGYAIKDVLTVWGVTAAGFGIAAACFGNAWVLPTLILRGMLDPWLLYPRLVLPHLVLGKMVASSVGDGLFGLIIYVAFVRPDLPHLGLFLLFALSGAAFFLSLFIVAGSLAFFLGNAESVAEQWRFSLVTFSTYPETLFHGTTKLILYSLIPAGFVSYLPVRILKQPAWELVGLTLLASVVALAVSAFIFYFGLRRYESGNLMEMRG